MKSTPSGSYADFPEGIHINTTYRDGIKSFEFDSSITRANGFRLSSLSYEGVLIITVKAVLDGANALLCFTFKDPISYDLHRMKSSSIGYFKVEIPSRKSEVPVLGAIYSWVQRLLNVPPDKKLREPVRFIFDCIEHRIEIRSFDPPEMRIIGKQTSKQAG